MVPAVGGGSVDFPLGHRQTTRSLDAQSSGCVVRFVRGLRGTLVVVVRLGGSARLMIRQWSADQT